MDGEMTMSEEIGEIAASLARAQALLGKLIASKKVLNKDKKTTRYLYADLADALEACRTTLNSEGIAVIQFPATPERNGIEVTTMLAHTSGQWLHSAPLFMPVSGGAQDVGSAITYGRRYQLLAMVGLAPEDDDGQKAQGAKPDSWGSARPSSRPPNRSAPKPDSLGPRCSGKKGASISIAIDKRLAIIDESDMGAVFAEALKGAEVDVDKYGPDGPPRAQVLTIQDGAKVAGWLKVELGRRGLVEDGP